METGAVKIFQSATKTRTVRIRCDRPLAWAEVLPVGLPSIPGRRAVPMDSCRRIPSAKITAGHWAKGKTPSSPFASFCWQSSYV
jgi:hypothetical protein